MNNRNRAVPQAENDVRVNIFNSFMSCPHRDTELARKIHEEIRQKDPLFYSHLASWYWKQQDQLRDHNELFSGLLVTDPFLENREVGLALFREQPPVMKDKIVQFIKGKTVKIREKMTDSSGMPVKVRVGNKFHDKVKITEKKVGLNRSLPNCLKTEVEAYLKFLESDSEKFDSVVMRNAKELKDLYFARGPFPYPHSERAQKILFEGEYPKDSRLCILKEIAAAKTPETAAELIVRNKIPYQVAVGLLDKITPSVLVALINSMTEQEVINNIASLKEKGAMDNPDTNKIIMAKLEKAKTSKKVSSLKSKTAVGTGRIKDAVLVKKLDEIADVQIQKTGTIKIPTAIFVDRSGSMEEAIEVGKRVSAFVSGITTADLYVVAFDVAPAEIKSEGKTLTDWEKAFRPIRAGGGTSVGCALQYLAVKKISVEQVVVVTDEGENQSPYFHEEYPDYVKATGVSPHVVIIHVGGGDDHAFRNYLSAARISHDVYTPNAGDNYSLPGLATLLARKSKLELVMEIMDTPLLKRKPFRK